MSEAVMLYMTAADAAAADRLARLLVEARLAACVNILGPIRSVYRWQGAVETAAEVALVAKSRAALVDAAQALVRQHHGYDVPCIVSLPITGGNPDFLRWIAEETGPAAGA